MWYGVYTAIRQSFLYTCIKAELWTVSSVHWCEIGYFLCFDEESNCGRGRLTHFLNKRNQLASETRIPLTTTPARYIMYMIPWVTWHSFKLHIKSSIYSNRAVITLIEHSVTLKEYNFFYIQCSLQLAVLTTINLRRHNLTSSL